MTRSLQDAAIAVLQTAEPVAKARRARKTASAWRDGALAYDPDWHGSLPDRPARPDRPRLVPPARVPRRRLTSEAGRTALLHAVAHIEFNAIDLAFDMAVRFGGSAELDATARHAFLTDWIGVGDDEARHFQMVSGRLSELGAAYGDLDAHDGLWSAAMATSDDIAARLAIAPLVLEARGLDVTPGMIDRLVSAGDRPSAEILTTIYNEEIGHVAAGRRWLDHVCASRGQCPRETFHRLVRERFPGGLKLPVNAIARAEAGLEPDFYEPLLPQ
ncbi:rhamnosyltransferase [Glycocaulis albus]|uniref:Rhamnosyltransferase n=1 Tax=Glycocaulis albus TaxID=1382801 RepID=A0ABQ1XRX8_9PROT|nr:ferritin-like domain-containing protein [Glycocaulis albus]GGH01083.1 rhamnosyltransferase [Glycocaulis albus]